MSKYDDLWVENLMPDGNNPNNWTVDGNRGTKESLSDHIVRFTGNGTSKTLNPFTSSSARKFVKAGHKVFLKSNVRFSNTEDSSRLTINVVVDNSPTISIYDQKPVDIVEDTFHSFYTIIQPTQDTYLRFSYLISYPDASIQNGSYIDVKDCMIIDMGMEGDPLYDKTAEEMNQLFPDYFLYQEINPLGRDVWVKNLNQYGNFKDLTSWNKGSATALVANNVMTLTGSGTSGGFWVGQTNPTYLPTVSIGQRVFFTSLVKIPDVTNLQTVELQVTGTGTSNTLSAKKYTTSTTITSTTYFGDGTWKILCGIVDLPETMTTNKCGVAIYTSWGSASNANGKQVFIQKVMSVDMGYNSSHPLYDLTESQMVAITDEYFSQREINPYSEKMWIADEFGNLREFNVPRELI